jgi:light-regulated signal transduction histidine kinase (bacteriophytochrome)
MGQLIDALLAFSRAGRAELHKEIVDLDALAKDIITDLSPDTKERQIRWQIGDLPGVNADVHLLRSVLTNLFSNAIKFTRLRDEATIEIGCTQNEREHIFFIRDNGVGFDMKYIDKLFGVFQRLHSMSEFEGTGIGLANVRRIIQRHGGRTWAESVLNEGATFYFSLPKPTTP